MTREENYAAYLEDKRLGNSYGVGYGLTDAARHYISGIEFKAAWLNPFSEGEIAKAVQL